MYYMYGNPSDRPNEILTPTPTSSGMYESFLEMWQDGSLLSISSAAPTASGARLMGSSVEEGFLLCRPPPCHLEDGESGADRVCPWGPPPSREEAENEGGEEDGA